MTEPWLDKRGLARHLSCSVKSIERAQVAGMPHAIIFGRIKFRASEAEAWLEEHGYLERPGAATTITPRIEGQLDVYEVLEATKPKRAGGA
ncbi:MAG TPA: hypothetical protein VK701_01245 [Solirubrobacteraceae bacterium]|jgi:hypothetical protein|nr:hypothetical protein [Solirubrobacteraceae bacterium]